MIENQGRELILAAVEAHTASVREGTDSLVVFYRWRQAGGDNAAFIEHLNRLVDEGWLDLVPGPDMRLRLRAQAFAALDAQLPPPAEVALDDLPDEVSWGGLDAGEDASPKDKLRESLRGIYRILGVGPERPVSAGTLAKIWALEKRRGADLRLALDLLTSEGDLLVTRGNRTTFALTATGLARLNR